MDKDKLREAAEHFKLDPGPMTAELMEHDALAERILSLLASGEWVMVPVEPYRAQTDEFRRLLAEYSQAQWMPQAVPIYKAMIAAAPDPLEES